MNHLAILTVTMWWCSWIRVDSLHTVYILLFCRPSNPPISDRVCEAGHEPIPGLPDTFYWSWIRVAYSNHTRNGWKMMRLYDMHINAKQKNTGHIDHRIILQPASQQTQPILWKSQWSWLRSVKELLQIGPLRALITNYVRILYKYV